MNIKYLSLIDTCSSYHHLKLDKKSSYLTIFSCPFGRYRYIRLPLKAAIAGDMFQKKMDKLLSDMSNIFGISDDILIASFDKQSRDHEETLDKVLWVCKQANVKLNKGRCLFICTIIPFFGKVISWKGVSPNPRKVQTLTEMLPTKSKNKLK